eukprot:scaffold21391_cov67-Phaeocystis_antarctica.AAC.6
MQRAGSGAGWSRGSQRLKWKSRSWACENSHPQDPWLQRSAKLAQVSRSRHFNPPDGDVATRVTPSAP